MSGSRAEATKMLIHSDKRQNLRAPSWLLGAIVTFVTVASLCLLYAWTCYRRLPFDFAQAAVPSCLRAGKSLGSMPVAAVEAGQILRLGPACYIEGREWIRAGLFDVEAPEDDAPRHTGYIRKADVRCTRSTRFLADYLAPPAGHRGWLGVLKTVRSASVNSMKLVLPALAISVLVSYTLAFASLEARFVAPLSLGVGITILLCTVASAFPVFVLGYIGNGLSGTGWLNADFWRRYGAVLVITVGNLVLADMTQHFRAELKQLRRQRYVKELAAMKGVRFLPHYWQPLLVAIVTVVKPRVPLFIGLSLIVEVVCNLDWGLGSLAYKSIVYKAKDFPCFFGAIIVFLLVVWAVQFVHWWLHDVWLYKHAGRHLVEL